MKLYNIKFLINEQIKTKKLIDFKGITHFFNKSFHFIFKKVTKFELI